jgi:myo-inositol-1(or 4)-monophosphatase
MIPSLEFMIDLARQAGEILRQNFSKPHQVEYKGITDPVTEADRRSEQYLLQQILDSFPTHTIVSEESGLHSGNNAHTWYIDPLDGTVNYAHGVPIYAVSIAYAYQGQMQAGVIFDPMQNECFSAEYGKGAWLNEKPIRVSKVSDLIRSLLVSGFPYDIRTAQETNLEHFNYFTLRSQAVRRLGSAALDLAYVGAGRLDAYWEISIKPWDIAAGALIVQEAGGKVTTLQGDPDYFKPPYALVAAAGGIHQQLLDGLNRQDKNPMLS